MQLLHDLRTGLQDAVEPEAALQLAEAFRQRSALFSKVARELDITLDALRRARVQRHDRAGLAAIWELVAASKLDLVEQLSVVADLKAHLQVPLERTAVLQLFERLRQREDLYNKTAQEVDRLLADESRAEKD